MCGFLKINAYFFTFILSINQGSDYCDYFKFLPINIVYDTHIFHITFNIQYKFPKFFSQPHIFFVLLYFSLFSYVLLIFHDSYSKTNSIFIVHVFRFWVVQDWKLIISHSHYHIMLSSFLFSFIVLHKLFFIPFIVFSFRWETKWLEMVTHKKPITRKKSHIVEHYKRHCW